MCSTTGYAKDKLWTPNYHKIGNTENIREQLNEYSPMRRQGKIVINTFFWDSVWGHQEILNFPYANMKWFV